LGNERLIVYRYERAVNPRLLARVNNETKVGGELLDKSDYHLRVMEKTLLYGSLAITIDNLLSNKMGDVLFENS
jgi:hypothetical protein